MESSHTDKVVSSPVTRLWPRTVSVGFAIALVATLLNLASPLMVVLDLIVGIKVMALASEYRLQLVGDLLWVVAVILLMTGNSSRPVDDTLRLRRTWAVLGLVLSASRYLWPELLNNHIIPEAKGFAIPYVQYLCGVAGYIGLLALLSYLRVRMKDLGYPLVGISERLRTLFLVYGIAGALSLVGWFGCVLLPMIEHVRRTPEVFIRLLNAACVGLVISLVALAHALFVLARSSYRLSNNVPADG